MEHRTKRELALFNLVSDFEAKYEQGNVEYMTEKKFNQLIDFYESKHQHDKAMEVVELALTQYKYRSDFYITKARLLFSDRKVDKCLQVLEEAENIAPFEREIPLLKIKAYSAKKEFQKAKDLMIQMKDMFFIDDMADYYIAESYIFEFMFDYSKMSEVLRVALENNPRNVEALERFWLSIELSKKYNEGVEMCQWLIDQNPYNYSAWFYLGMAYTCEREYEKAIDAFDYSFVIEPNFEAAYLECAELCMQTGNHAKALSIYKEVLERFGPDTDVLVDAARCCIELNDTNEAKKQLLKALKYDPYNDEIYFFLGNCYAEDKNYYRAINAYYKAVELDPEREEFYLNLAKAYVAVEDYNKATINFHKATQICLEDPMYWKEYVCFILKMGLYDEAMQILDEAEEHTYGTELVYCRAITLFFLKNKSEGIDRLAEALEDEFDQHRIIFDLAPELEVDKEISSIIKYFQMENEEIV